MSFVLDGQILPKYNKIKQENLELSAKHFTLTGATRKDIVRIKYRFVLRYENLNNTQLSQILNIYRGEEAKSLLIDEPFLSLGTTVNVEIDGIDRRHGGSLNSITLILEEI